MSRSSSFPIRPTDWKADTRLRRCSPAARGTWLDLLCQLHRSDEYGVIRLPLVELARVAGAKVRHVQELVAKGVLEGGGEGCPAVVYLPPSGLAPVTLLDASQGPCWYCSRLLIDQWQRSARRGRRA